MDFTLTSDQSMIKASVERFVAENYAFAKRSERVNAPGFSREHWSTFAELGWLGLPIPAERGGFGGTAIDTAILLEAFGAGLVTEPFIPAVVVAGSVLAAAAGTHAQAMLDDLIAGTSLVTLGYLEPHAGYDPANVRTTAVHDGDSLVIDGAKVAVPFAASADWAIVSVRTPDDAGAGTVTLVSIPHDAAGFSRRDYDTYDERRASDLSFSNVRVPADHVLGPAGGGLALLDAALDRGNVALCAEAVGIMGVLQRGTVDYLKTRVQFGRPIGSFQALQHRAVDMLVQLEMARAITTFAAASIDTGDALAARRAAAAAKAQVADSGRFVGESAIQLHGAIGLTEELFVGHYVKRLTMLQRELGDAAFAIQRYIATPA